MSLISICNITFNCCTECSNLWVNEMDYNFFDQVSVTGHLGWFQPFTVIKNGYDKHLCTRVYRSKFLEEKLLTQRYDIYLNKPQVG